jgi:hypothetical protein
MGLAAGSKIETTPPCFAVQVRHCSVCRATARSSALMRDRITSDACCSVPVWQQTPMMLRHAPPTSP